MRRTRNISSNRAVTGKSILQRTCVACRQIKTKREMLRLVRTPPGEVTIDLTGKKEGRGAYICRDWACWEKIFKGKQLEHALKAEITQADIERLGKTGREILKESISG
ncbi:MAG: RNase P modulator RnpM [Dehalococcoidales bacterium]